MENRPKVSVIIPVYNVEKYLRECLDSVTNQTLRDIEIICVNDGSRDGSLKMLEAYAEKDERIRVISTENHGVSHARNLGLDAATGAYLCFVDADDHVDLGCFQAIYDIAEEQDGDIVVFGGKCFPTANPWADEILSPRAAVYSEDSLTAVLKEKGCRPFICGKLYKRELFEENGIRFFEDLALGEDQVLQFQIFPKAKKLVFTDKKFYFYRQDNADSATARHSQMPGRKRNMHLMLAERVLEIWEKEGYLQTHGCGLVEWMLRFLYHDLMDAGEGQKLTGCKILSSLIRRCGDISRLEAAQKKQLASLEEIAAHEYAPLVSVIVPVYNARRYLPECLSSLAKQTFIDFEMIFVDDGSEDDSLQQLHQFAEEDFRVTVLTQEHGFAGAARNLGIRHAKGNYLLFLDADDFFDKRMIQKAYEKIRLHDADICVFGSQNYDQRTKCFSPTPWTCNLARYPAFSRPFSLKDEPVFIFAFTTPAPWNKLFKKSFVLEKGLEFQRTRSANDMAFVMSALAVADKIVALDEVLLSYRVNNEESLQGSQDKLPTAFYDAILELRNRLENYGVYSAAEQAFVMFALDFCFYNLGTLKSKKGFEQIYFLLKNRAFEEIDAIDKPAEYFVAYKTNRIYEKMKDVLELSILEYVEKYDCFPHRPSAMLEGANIPQDMIAENRRLKEELERTRRSLSFRLGRGLTFLPRKLRGGYRCLRENGFRYTIRRFMAKIFH